MRENSPNERRDEALELFQRAFERQMRGDFDRAVVLYKQSLATFPTAEAHTFLGWTYSFMGLVDDAIEECKRAIEVDPTFGNPYNDIGAYLLEKDQVEDAIPWFEKALQAPRYESYCFPHFNLGRVYERKGNVGRALTEYRQALGENPRHVGALHAVRRLIAQLN